MEVGINPAGGLSLALHSLSIMLLGEFELNPTKSDVIITGENGEQDKNGR